MIVNLLIFAQLRKISRGVYETPPQVVCSSVCTAATAGAGNKIMAIHGNKNIPTVVASNRIFDNPFHCVFSSSFSHRY
jgi:hypothetical protein